MDDERTDSHDPLYFRLHLIRGLSRLRELQVHLVPAYGDKHSAFTGSNDIGSFRGLAELVFTGDFAQQWDARNRRNMMGARRDPEEN
jgi:hypothetical protein